MGRFHGQVVGRQHKLRSATFVHKANTTTAYLGKCEPCKHPVRVDTEHDFGPTRIVRCHDCQGKLVAARLARVTTAIECDGSCRAAFGPDCNCGCGGVNHGQFWSTPINTAEKLESEVAAALGKYREHEANLAIARKDRKAKKFEAWKNEGGHAQVVEDLMAEFVGPTAQFPNSFLAKMQKLVEDGEPLTANMVYAVRKAVARRQAARKFKKGHQAPAPAHYAKKDPSEYVEPGVFVRDGKTYVVQFNQDKTRKYAKVLTEIGGTRVTEAGTFAKFELSYAPGAIARLTEANRMSQIEASAFAIKYGQCVRCFRRLKDAKSVTNAQTNGGYGPDCVKIAGAQAA